MKTLDEAPAEPPLRAVAGATVLLVDDEDAVRRLAGRILEQEGYAVREASDGAEALELVRQGVVFEVVVSDIVMPRLNGVELMQALAALYPDLPIILMSGYTTTALADLGIVVPCAILVKPFPPERLLEEVRRCIRRR
jgi:DNA-binding NtrC family response regulator